MRTRLRLLGAAVGLTAALAVTGAASAQIPLQDSATGSGTALLTSFTGSSQSGPSGENPTGFVTVSGFLSFSATTTCLNVSGNAAVIGYRIDSGTQGFLVSIQDNGAPVNGQPVDEVLYSGLLPSPPTSCPAPGAPPPPDFSSSGGGPLISGDVTVVDAPSLPTTQAQCRDGGWKTYGAFKNEGDCVSFVATGGKNPPANATP